MVPPSATSSGRRSQHRKSSNDERYIRVNTLHAYKIYIGKLKWHHSTPTFLGPADRPVVVWSSPRKLVQLEC